MNKRLIVCIVALLTIACMPNTVLAELLPTTDSESVEKSNSIYNEYKKKVKKYEKKYGTAKNFPYSSDYCLWNGVCFLRLLDMNKDGKDELILGYSDDVGTTYSNNKKYYINIYYYKDGKVKRAGNVYSMEGQNGPFFGAFDIVKYKGKYLVKLSPNPFNEIYYLGFNSNGNIKSRYTFKEINNNIMNPQYTYNGKKIDGTKMNNLSNKLNKSKTNYSFYNKNDVDRIQKLINKTKKKLGM